MSSMIKFAICVVVLALVIGVPFLVISGIRTSLAYCAGYAVATIVCAIRCVVEEDT